MSLPQCTFLFQTQLLEGFHVNRRELKLFFVITSFLNLAKLFLDLTQIREKRVTIYSGVGATARKQ